MQKSLLFFLILLAFKRFERSSTVLIYRDVVYKNRSLFVLLPIDKVVWNMYKQSLTHFLNFHRMVSQSESLEQ